MLSQCSKAKGPVCARPWQCTLLYLLVPSVQFAALFHGFEPRVLELEAAFACVSAPWS